MIMSMVLSTKISAFYMGNMLFTLAAQNLMIEILLMIVTYLAMLIIFMMFVMFMKILIVHLRPNFTSELPSFLREKQSSGFTKRTPSCFCYREEQMRQPIHPIPLPLIHLYTRKGHAGLLSSKAEEDTRPYVARALDYSKCSRYV